MSTSSSVKVVLKGDTTLSVNIAESLLASLSEITASVANAKIQQNVFLEVGSYFHRVSSGIKELSKINPDNAIEILQSLSEDADIAKGILGRLQQSGQTISDNEVKTTITQLEEIVKKMGENLSLIPTSAFRDEKYAETAIRSLSEEMRRIGFDVRQTLQTKDINQQLRPSYLDDHPHVESTPRELDLYSISMVVCTENSHVSGIPQLVEVHRTASQNSQRHSRNLSIRSPAIATEVAQFEEPLYKSFCCPLSNEIMDDPVTIESGVTYERKAISEYFENFGNSEVVCPTTKEKLQSRAMSPNIALRNIIQEWKDRNETARLKVIRAALSIGITDDMILEALKNLRNICQRSPKKIIEVRNIGIIPLLVRLLEVRDRNVRCAALDITLLLAEADEGKELIGKTPAVATTIRLLSSSYQPIRHAALLLLIELSKSRSLSDKIGRVKGGILILIQNKYNRAIDTFASEAADQVLRNMEQCPNNIKYMAESGYLEPLVNNLVEGSDERKLQMVTYLGEATLEDDSKTYVAERTTPVLIQMLQSTHTLTRKAVFKALAQISSCPANGKILVEAGILRTIVEEMFTKNLFSEPMDSLKEASAVLANILESGAAFEDLMVNSQGHTMISGYVVFNIIHMINNSTPDELNLNLIRMLYSIAKCTKSAAPIVSVVKKSEASYTLIELLNNPNDDIAIAAIKLLTLLSPHIGHLLIERLCKTSGQPEGLVQLPSDPSHITERQALSVSFLSKLPHQNITLNSALLNKNTIPIILLLISQIQTEIRQNRYALMCLEGLVGVVVRFTATLYDPQMLFGAIDYNITTVLSDLLIETSSEEVQRLSAIGLEKLSAQSIHLSKPPPQAKKKKFLNLFYLPNFLVFGSSRKTKAKVCIAHKGVCSKQKTFCLLEGRTVERLLKCLEHQNAKVVESALSALSTLLDDKVEIAQSVHMLIEMNAIQQVLKAVRNHKNEILWQKALWMLERFLRKGGERSLALVSQDRLFSVTVVTAFHHGDAYTRQMAEKVLRYLDKMPSLTGTFTM